MISVKCGDLNIQKIADSGQCFRLNKIDDAHFCALASDNRVIIKSTENGAEFYCTDEEYKNFWQGYFDMCTDYSKFAQSIPREDEFLTQAAEYSKGIRILKQDPWEMLVTFIISQRKNIPAIKKSVELLCDMCMADTKDKDNTNGFAFPTPQQVALLTQDQLAECKLGYRARYINAAANAVANGEIDLEKIAQKGNEELLSALLTVQGVGVKVANCVMLFGYYRLDGFPRDVWINRVIDEVYSGEFDAAPYKGFEGIIQQYMFYFGRSAQCAEKFLK